jgi:hypothetical protein
LAWERRGWVALPCSPRCIGFVLLYLGYAYA